MRMRQQYHFRKVGEDIYIWDVNKLLEQYQDLPAVAVPLSDIGEWHEPYWYEATEDVPTCASIAMHARLIDEADLDYPILLYCDGRVMDGMHRICRAQMLGHSHISAIRLPEAIAPDYINVAADDLPYD